ncbi:MAG: hypothetical protein JWS12_332 [Candidatus Saccharibacteria bacterium]|nr:hypothetical protein [Candidatus Saccharibacteria bacterium]
MKLINKKNWKLLLTIATSLALVGLIIAARHQIFDTISNLGRVNAWALPLMLVWQGLEYHAYANMYKELFQILGERIRYKPLLRVALELNFVNNVFPSGGVSGVSYFALRMRDAEVPASKSTVVQLTKFILIFVSFQILMGLGLIMLAFGGHVNNFTILIAGSLFTLLLVATIGVGIIVSSRRRINAFFTFVANFLNKVIHIFRPKSPETINIERGRKIFDDLHDNYLELRQNYLALRQPLLNALLCNICEVLTIYTVYVAFGHWVNPGAIIIAYAVASVSGLISVLPGGVGIYEATMTAVLAAAGIKAGISIPVTVMYRILNMLIQLPIGYYFYNRRLHEKRAVV